MKKISLLLILSFLMFSCIDEPITEIENENNEAVQLVKANRLNKSSNSYSFLKFKDIKTFNQTIQNLKNEAENYDDNFIASYPDLSGEKLTDKEIEIGFNHYETFENFTNKLNFKNSMLDAFVSEEKKWLSNEVLNTSKDPSIRFLEMEPEEMSVLNEDGVVQIGSDIFIQAQNGYVTIPENNIDGLFSYLDGFDFSGIGPIIIDWGDILGWDFGDFSDWFDNLPQATCNNNSQDTEWWNYSSTRKIKGVVKSHTGQWFGGVYLKSKTVYYRRYWFFGYHWIQTRSAELTAALDGTYAGYDCGDMYNHYYEDVNYRHRTNKYRVIYQIDGDTSDDEGFQITNNEMKGVHKKASFRQEHYIR